MHTTRSPFWCATGMMAFWDTPEAYNDICESLLSHLSVLQYVSPCEQDLWAWLGSNVKYVTLLGTDSSLSSAKQNEGAPASVSRDKSTFNVGGVYLYECCPTHCCLGCR